MTRVSVVMGFLAILVFSSCGGARASVSKSSSPTSTRPLTAINGQVQNPHDLPALGTYEGAGMEVVVTDTGATLSTGCRIGSLPTPITLRADGSFTSNGTLAGDLPTLPATNTPITLDGKYSDQDQSLSFALTLGTEGDTRNYNVVLNGPKNLPFACPRVSAE